MTGIHLSNEVGAALMRAGMHPRVLDVDVFEVIWEGDRYVVYTDSLPEIYIQKTLPTDSFDYGNEEWIVVCAMEDVNQQRTPVTVIRPDGLETVTFRYCLCPESTDSLIRDLHWCFLRIERAVESFGHACVSMNGRVERETLSELMNGLQNPTSDSPWIQGKIRS